MDSKVIFNTGWHKDKPLVKLTLFLVRDSTKAFSRSSSIFAILDRVEQSIIEH
jgi:hypothetical protein